MFIGYWLFDLEIDDFVVSHEVVFHENTSLEEALGFEDLHLLGDLFDKVN